eukprot:10634539-Alexandrium_andersonii.AAC.1
MGHRVRRLKPELRGCRNDLSRRNHRRVRSVRFFALNSHLTTKGAVLEFPRGLRGGSEGVPRGFRG